MQLNKRSLATFPITILQTLLGWAAIVFCLGMVILFGLQFNHSPKLDTLWVVTQLHLYGDPLLTDIAPYFNSKWPLSSLSFVPLAVALIGFGVKLGANAALTRARKGIAGLIPAEKGKAVRAAAGLGEETEIGAETAQDREQLLKKYREYEAKLKGLKKKPCTFLSIDVVGSTQMKVGERENQISATFQAYEEMLKKIFKQYGAWKDAWTPDGVMVCFLQVDLAAAAGIYVLQKLKKFNESDNTLRTPFRLRCGVNHGEVQIYEDTKLEKVVAHEIDVAGHMQKEGRPNCLWLSEEVYNLLADKTGFHPISKQVDDLNVYEWSLDAPPPELKPKPAPLPARATLAGAATPASIVAGGNEPGWPRRPSLRKSSRVI